MIESGKPGKLSRRRAHPEEADSRELARLLRPRGNRPDRCAAEEADERAAFLR